MFRISPLRPFPFLRTLMPLLAIATTLGAQDVAVASVDSSAAMSRSSLGASRDAAATAERRFAVFGNAASDLRRLYGDGEPVLLWSRDGAPTAPARAALDALERVGGRGLDPAMFEVGRLRELSAGRFSTIDEQFQFDAMLSAASITAFRALRGGRASNADSSMRSAGVSAADVSQDVRALAESTTPDDVLDAAEPASSQYQLLKGALGTYRTLAERSPDALAELERIVSTLERARAQRVTESPTSVVVNIPAFRLQASGGSEADSLAMNVVVGVASKHRTPEMSDSIQYLVFAPYWEVPVSITRAELLPIARRDPYLLTTNNYQIVDRKGRVLPANARSVNAVAAGRARIRQLPGGTNSLGRVKFIFPNREDIYLHDTPLQNDFARSRRDQSHGCVRVADPTALAQFLLRDQPEWTAERIEQAMSGKVPVTVKLTRPVPIHLTYATAVARPDGSVDFFDDVYNLDVPLRTGRQ